MFVKVFNPNISISSSESGPQNIKGKRGTLLDLTNICCGCAIFEVFVPDEEMKVTGYPTLLSISHNSKEGVC